MNELLTATATSPWLFPIVVLVCLAMWAIERLFALNGLFSRIGSAFTDRELNKIRKEALLRAERRKMDLAEAGPEVIALRTRVEELIREVAGLKSELQTAASARAAEAAAASAHERRMLAWGFDLYSRARAAGIHADPPPEPLPATA